MTPVEADEGRNTTVNGPPEQVRGVMERWADIYEAYKQEKIKAGPFM